MKNKRITTILMALMSIFLFTFCSNDDDVNKNYKWVVKLAPDCETNEPRVPYCVTQEEYNRLDNLTGPCEIITLTDVFGRTYQGVPLGFSYSIYGQNCG